MSSNHPGGSPVGPGRLRVYTDLVDYAESGKVRSVELFREIPASSHIRILGRVYYEHKRSERYIAISAGHPIPIGYALEGIENFRCQSSQSEVFMTSSQRFEIAGEISGIYRSADHLLSAIADDSYVGKSVESVGASILSEDLDVRYVHAWNGIELLAKENHFEHNPNISRIAGGQRNDPRNIGQCVEALIKEYHDGDVPPDLDWLYYLRNGSAHGGLSVYPGKSLDEYVERWEKSEAIQDLALEVLVNYLSGHSLIPPVSRPFHRRVLIPSLGLNRNIEPVDDSPSLANRGSKHTKE